MSHKSFLTLSVFFCFFGSSLFIYAMNDEDHQYPVFLPRKNKDTSCSSFTSQVFEENSLGNKEELLRFVQTTVLESLSRLHDDIPREERSFNAGSFRPIFDDENVLRYKKLEPSLMHSLVDNAPEKLKFIIKLYANARSFAVLSKNSCFKNKFLFYGLPGAGKSSLAKAFADYCDIPREFFVAASFLNQYQHSGQQNLRELFEQLMNNRKPRVIIFDEFNGIARVADKKSKRNHEEETLSVLLNILDQIENLKNIVFIATTNNVKDLPPQIKDRFSGSMFEIRHPNNSQNLKYLNELDDSDDEKEDVENDNKEIILSDNEKIKFKTSLTLGDKKFISSTMVNFSCRDRNEMRDTARLLALREYVDENFDITQLHIPLTKEHLLEAIQEIQKGKQIEAPSNWKWYKKRFKEYYPLILSTVQVIGGLGLQCYGIRQQANFAQIAHSDQMVLMTNFQDSQMKFYERTHEQQVSFQNQMQENQLELQKTFQKEQLKQMREMHREQFMLQLHTSAWGLIMQGIFGFLRT